jgi:hypothetical protein
MYHCLVLTLVSVAGPCAGPEKGASGARLWSMLHLRRDSINVALNPVPYGVLFALQLSFRSILGLF